MPEIQNLIASLSNLTAILSVLSLLLAVLILVDCMFLYRRVTTFVKKQNAKGVSSGELG